MTQTDMIRYAITFILVGGIMFVRLRGSVKPRRLRLETLWIVPAIYTLFAALLFWRMPPAGLGWLWSAIALLGGAALGWWRGRMVAVTIDPETHFLNQRSSPAAIIFILALVGIRVAMRSTIALEDARWHIGAALITDVFVASAIGLLLFNRLEIFLRARRLLRVARAR